MIQRIRDEAHRFAIGFYRKKHRQETTRSLLDNVPGLGPKHRRALLKHFGTIDALRAAEVTEVATIVGDRLAATIHERL